MENITPLLSTEERKALMSCKLGIGKRLMKVKKMSLNSDKKIQLVEPLQVAFVIEEVIEMMEIKRIEGEIFVIFNGNKRDDLFFALSELSSITRGAFNGVAKEGKEGDTEKWFVDETVALSIANGLNVAAKERATKLIAKLTNDMEAIKSAMAVVQDGIKEVESFNKA